MQTKQTALHAQHLSGEASMGEEAGWSMPLRFGAVAEEVQACRERAGVFDVSNVGRLRVRGDGALELLERVCTHDVARQEDNTASPTLLLNERGGILDMGILYRLDRFWVLTTSPDNREKILAHLQAQEIAGVKIDDQTNKVAQLAAVAATRLTWTQHHLPDTATQLCLTRSRHRRQPVGEPIPQFRSCLYHALIQPTLLQGLACRKQHKPSLAV